jgi:hypothetical protein
MCTQTMTVNRSAHRCRSTAVAFALAAFTLAVAATAQKTTSSPATDSSVESSPLQPAPKAKVIDSSAESSPEIGPVAHHGISIAPGTAIPVHLSRAIDSGKLKNGETVSAKLSAPVRTASGGTLAAGTAVAISVIATVPAGKLTAAGEFSLQALRVGSVDVYTDTRTYRGKPGHRDVADASPAMGTDAGLPAGASLTFHVLKPPLAVTTAPKNAPVTPGSVDGTASGGPPPAGSKSNSGEPVFGGGEDSSGSSGNNSGNKPTSNAGDVAPADNSFGTAQHQGQATSSPNSTQPATSGSQGSTTQPR